MAGTIGHDVSGSGYNNTSATTQRATTGATFTYTAVANDVVSEIGLHAATYTGDGSGWEIGVYDLTANGGISGAPLVATGTITALTANSRNTLAITPVALTAGSEYCVAIRTGSATTISIQGDYVGGGTTQSTFDGTSPLQATFTSGALIGQRWSFFAIVTTAATPTLSLTAPDTVTHGVATTATGALLSTVNVTTGMTLEYGTVAIAQTAVLNVADLDFTPDVGVPTLYGSGNAVDSLPLTPDSASAGTTAYQVTLDVTDGVTPVSRNVTNIAAGAVQTFQVMAAGVNTTVGEGLGGSDLVAIEDNHQVTVPSAVNGVTITIDADTLDYQLDQTEMAAAGGSIAFDAFYYSPSTQQSSKIAVTIPTSARRTMTAWIEANGAGGQVNDAWITYMKGAGASGKTFNDLMFSWLGGLGYTGSLSDRVAAWSKVNLN